MDVDKEKQTSIKLNENLYKKCQNKLDKERITFKDLITGCINLYLSGSIYFSGYNFKIMIFNHSGNLLKEII